MSMDSSLMAGHEGDERAALYRELEKLVADRELTVTGPVLVRMLATMIMVNAENRKDDPIALCEEFMVPQLMRNVRELADRRADQ